jgi:hypothetical protein
MRGGGLELEGAHALCCEGFILARIVRTRREEIGCLIAEVCKVFHTVLIR